MKKFFFILLLSAHRNRPVVFLQQTERLMGEIDNLMKE